MEKANSNKYHWIMYHLEALDYGREKVDNKISKLPAGQKLVRLTPKEHREVISQLKEIISWYEKFIQYHQQKALSHIPETEKTLWAKEKRKLENSSYENIFLNANEIAKNSVNKRDFKTADELNEK